MGINRSEAEARLQRALMAWRRVAERVRATAQVRRAEEPNHDRASCPVCVRHGPCVYVDAVIVPEKDLIALADGFDLMALLWSELEAATAGAGPDVAIMRVRVCADTDPGETMVHCACGCARPANRPHGWRRPEPSMAALPNPSG